MKRYYIKSPTQSVKMSQVITVTDLSARLSAASQARKDMRMQMQMSQSPTTIGRFTVKTVIEPKFGLGNPAKAVRYYNKNLALGIQYFGMDHFTEDASACILYDLANMPLEMVLTRLESEGAILE